MGRKSKEANTESVKSLFSADNPFRRKPHLDIATAPSPQPLGLANPNPNPNPAVSESGKRKRNNESPNPNPNPDPVSTPKKPKNQDAINDGENSHKKKKKRKRDELEEKYEMKRFGEAGPAAVPVPVIGAKRKAEVAAAEMPVSKDTFDDESKMLRTVFVGNLPLKTKKTVLIKEFARFGEVESVRIRSVPIVDSKIPRKGAIIKGKVNDAFDSMHAYIVFKDEQSAQASLSYNMAEVQGNHIRVDMACPPRKKFKGETPLYDRKRTLFVGNLPFDVKDEELYQLFCGPTQSESGVEAVRVVRDPVTSFGKGIAYVLFKSREAASSTMKKRDLKIRDRLLRICYAKQDATPSKPRETQVKRDFSHKRMASSPSESPSSMRNNANAKAARLSYQGLRASKSDVPKKSGIREKPSFRRPSSGHGNQGFKRAAAGMDPKVHKGKQAKRPAVAARKAKALHSNKRKQETGTPVNTHRNKKPRKH